MKTDYKTVFQLAQDRQIKTIAKVIKDGLPHAFDYKYWDIANTTYKEELAKAFIDEMKMDNRKAKQFLRMCGIYKNEFPVLYYVIDGHLEESMGAHYGKTKIGEMFIDDFITSKVKKSYKEYTKH